MVKLELGLLVIGLIAIVFMFGQLSDRVGTAQSLKEEFRPGSIGAKTVAASVIAGIVGVVLLPTNCFFGNHNWLVIRVVVASSFLFFAVLVCSHL